MVLSIEVAGLPQCLLLKVSCRIDSVFRSIIKMYYDLMLWISPIAVSAPPTGMKSVRKLSLRVFTFNLWCRACYTNIVPMSLAMISVPLASRRSLPHRDPPDDYLLRRVLTARVSTFSSGTRKSSTITP